MASTRCEAGCPQPWERGLSSGEAGRVLLLRDAGGEWGNDRAEPCRSGIECEQPDAGRGHVVVGGPAEVLVTGVMGVPVKAGTAAGEEHERANDAADVARACEHRELRVEAGS